MTGNETLEIVNVIIGTAGHIDHGKSSLVKALTGIDPDRLPEEQERGMTIDLGFARYLSTSGKLVGIIDVPGHEKFVKNMVAGATSIDVVLLVVAADDGVMPQTREHLEILTLLGLRDGFTVVTKADLVEPQMLELAVDDVRTLLRDTFLADQPILTCSNVTGEGLDPVRREIDQRIARVPSRTSEGLFRMPIQRIFSAKGHGTVITGVPISGRVEPGDEVEILPPGLRGKVRSIQAYGTQRERALAGHSSALNITDVDYRLLTRGMVAATPGFFRSATLFDARLTYPASRKEPLLHRSPVKVHAGTAEIMGIVRIVDHEILSPGEEGLVQLELEEPLVAAAGDVFLIRRPSPPLTLGGGRILGGAAHHRRRLKSFHIDALRGREQALTDPLRAAELAAVDHRFQPFSMQELAVDLSLDEKDAQELLGQALKGREIIELSRGVFLSQQFFDQGRKQVLKVLSDLHKAHPLKKLIELREMRAAADLPEPTLKALLTRLVADGAVVEEGSAGQLRLASHKPAVDAKDERLLEDLRKAIFAADCSPPEIEALASRLGCEARHLSRLALLLCDEGDVVRVGTLFFDRRAVERTRAELIDNAHRHQGEVAIPELRDRLSTSRKYMIPLLEFFDGQGLTVRRGDKRFLRESHVAK